MKLNLPKDLFGSLLVLAGLAAGDAIGGTLTRISWTSNGGAYINDTIVDSTTSPLAFTATTNLAQPFLNAADSTVALNYGSYYVIAFRDFGAHIGAGAVSFMLDGATTYTRNVTFPDPTNASGVFAYFKLPNGDVVTISATGYAADRIRIIASGGGLTGDGTADAFYLFSYIRAVDVIVPRLMIVPATPGHATISWTPATPGFVLQENVSLEPASWTNSASGATNPVIVPTNLPKQFFRLIQP